MTTTKAMTMTGEGHEAGPMTELRRLLESRLPALREVATRHMSAEMLVRLIGAAASRAPRLAQCTPLSILQCAMTLAEIGLSPGPMGGAYLIPFRRRVKIGDDQWRDVYECQLIVGYRGLVILAHRAGSVTSLHSGVVRAGDEFTVAWSPMPHLEHTPAMDAAENRPITHVWAAAKLRCGDVQIETMTAAEVESVRRRSRAADDGPWVTDWPEMARKTVLRRLMKLIPLDAEAASAVVLADAAEYEGAAPEPRAAKHESQPTASRGLSAAKQRLAQGQHDPAVTEPQVPPLAQAAEPVREDAGVLRLAGEPENEAPPREPGQPATDNASRYEPITEADVDAALGPPRHTTVGTDAPSRRGNQARWPGGRAPGRERR